VPWPTRLIVPLTFVIPVLAVILSYVTEGYAIGWHVTAGSILISLLVLACLAAPSPSRRAWPP
jgi:hypothetical protein